MTQLIAAVSVAQACRITAKLAGLCDRPEAENVRRGYLYIRGDSPSLAQVIDPHTLQPIEYPPHHRISQNGGDGCWHALSPTRQRAIKLIDRESSDVLTMLPVLETGSLDDLQGFLCSTCQQDASANCYVDGPNNLGLHWVEPRADEEIDTLSSMINNLIQTEKDRWSRIFQSLDCGSDD